MVQFIAGEKGEGKTRKLIDMANEKSKTANGNIIFIDDDRRHMYDISRDIRFIETGKHFLSNTREFVGYLLGIMEMDNDIEHIYVDGLTNIIDTLNRNDANFNDDILVFSTRLSTLSEQSSVNFTISINCDRTTLPDEVKKLVI